MNRVFRDPAYPRLKNHLAESIGLMLHADRNDELAEFVGERLSVLHMHDCSSYADFLANGPGSEAEMDILIERLTVGETYFFRDPEQFAAIRDIIIPDILKRKQSSRRLRIWSAGCANGAEPYSIAILLMHEMAIRTAGWQIAIHATDLNRSNLTRAAAGKFREWALRATSDDIRRDCFSRDGRIWTIHPRYKRGILFQHVNLAGSRFSAPSPADSAFDLILCRNVMIYFTPTASLRLVEKLHDSLAEGGWLVVGPSEHNGENFRAFRTVTANGTSLYQKPESAAGAHLLPIAGVFATNAAPEDAVSTGVSQAKEALGTRSDAPGLASTGPANLRSADPGPANMEGLRQLSERGDWLGAAEYSQRLLTQDRLDPAIHFHQSVIFGRLGIVGRAEKSLRQAIYLDRHFAIAHYHLGLLLQKEGQIDSAERSFGNVLKILSSSPEDAMLAAGDGVTAAGLKVLAKTQLENKGGL